MNMAQKLHAAGGLVDRGDFSEADKEFDVTWRDLQQLQAPSSQGDFELLVMAICVRGLLDRMTAGKDVTLDTDTPIQMFTYVQAHLFDRSGADWAGQLQCVIAANMGEYARYQGDLYTALVRYLSARRAAPEASGEAVVALMQALAFIQAARPDAAAEHIEYGGGMVAERPSAFPVFVRRVATALMLGLRQYRPGFGPMPPTLLNTPSGDSARQLLATMGGSIASSHTLWHECYLPFHRPV